MVSIAAQVVNLDGGQSGIAQGGQRDLNRENLPCYRTEQ